MKIVAMTFISLVATGTALTGAGESAKQPCPQPASRGGNIGDGDVIRGRAYIDTSEKHGDKNSLNIGDIICTNGSGIFLFTVHATQKTVSCKVKSHSSLQLGPRYNWLVIYRTGKSRCQINGDKLRWLKTPDALVRTGDPQFTIDISHQQTTLTVRQGILRVTGIQGVHALTDPAATVIVGPGQQTTVHRGLDPAIPAAAPPETPDEQQDYAQLPKSETNFSAPPIQGSPALQRILGKNSSIVYGFDPKTVIKSVSDFASNFAGFQASSWKVNLHSLEPVPPATAIKDLQIGKLDTYLTRSLGLFGVTYLPLLTDPAGTTWYLVIRSGDKPFYDALRHFVISTIDSGFYDSLYRKIFDAAPRYDALRGLFFP